MNEPDPRGARRDPRREGCRQCCAPAARPRAADQSAPTADPHQVQQLDSKPGHQLDPWQRGRQLATVLTRCSLAAIGQACSSIRCSDAASISARLYRSTSTDSRANNKADDQGRRKKEEGRKKDLSISFSSLSVPVVPVLFPFCSRHPAPPIGTLKPSKYGAFSLIRRLCSRCSRSILRSRQGWLLSSPSKTGQSAASASPCFPYLVRTDVFQREKGSRRHHQAPPDFPPAGCKPPDDNNTGHKARRNSTVKDQQPI